MKKIIRTETGSISTSSKKEPGRRRGFLQLHSSPVERLQCLSTLNAINMFTFSISGFSVFTQFQKHLATAKSSMRPPAELSSIAKSTCEMANPYDNSSDNDNNNDNNNANDKYRSPAMQQDLPCSRLAPGNPPGNNIFKLAFPCGSLTKIK